MNFISSDTRYWACLIFKSILFLCLFSPVFFNCFSIQGQDLPEDVPEDVGRKTEEGEEEVVIPKVKERERRYYEGGINESDFELVTSGVSLQGTKHSKNEDAHVHYKNTNPHAPVVEIACVFDGCFGRGHDMVWEFCKKNVLSFFSKEFNSGLGIEKCLVNTCEKLDEEYLRPVQGIISSESGTTAVIVVVMRDGNLYVANVGTSAAVAYSEDQVFPMSLPHNAKELDKNPREKERVKDHFVDFLYFFPHTRVIGLAVVKQLDQSVLIATPEVKSCSIAENNLQFLVLATDGLWGAMKPEEVGTFVRGKLKNDSSVKDITNELSQKAYDAWMGNGYWSCSHGSYDTKECYCENSRIEYYDTDDITIEIIVFG